MQNAQITRIARLLVLIAAMANALLMASASAQQPRNKINATLFKPLRTASTTDLFVPSAAFSATIPAAFPMRPRSQTQSQTQPQTQPAKPLEVYLRPTFRERFRIYLFHTYGPLKITEDALSAAISQADDSPPDWHQGWGAYGQRFGSAVGAGAAGGTARFLTAEVLRVDTKYYPCACKGFLPRVGYALKSHITARAGDDGHRVFSIPALVAPYAGSFSTLLWYPSRYGPEDAFRRGNYRLLYSFGESVALEFLLPLTHKLHRH